MAQLRQKLMIVPNNLTRKFHFSPIFWLAAGKLLNENSTKQTLTARLKGRLKFCENLVLHFRSKEGKQNPVGIAIRQNFVYYHILSFFAVKLLSDKIFPRKYEIVIFQKLLKSFNFFPNQ